MSSAGARKLICTDSVVTSTSDIHDIADPAVAQVFLSYPGDVRPKLLQLRQLVMDVADNLPDIGGVEETLKWGEPSYLAKGGSTLRIGWKPARPDCFAMYFNCNSKLVDTFKELYPDLFAFEKNRAIIFHRENNVPVTALKHCIELSLRYHKIKHLPLLGS